MQSTESSITNSNTNAVWYLAAASMLYLHYRFKDEQDATINWLLYAVLFGIVAMYQDKTSLLKYVAPIVASNFVIQKGMSHEMGSIAAMLLFIVVAHSTTE